MEYSFPHYLLSKQSVDDRALNKDVLNALRAYPLPQPLRIIEVGGGIGTMLRRLIRWNIICDAEYVLVDENQENIEYASAWIQQWAEQAGFGWERQGPVGGNRPTQLRVCDATHDIHIRLERADVFDFIQKNQEPADLLIAHAFLDLLPLPDSLPLLFSLTNGLAWLTINFDGVTTLEPTIDAALDEHIARLYHRTMDTRLTGGDSQSGRHLFSHLRDLGAEILASGGSDWVVHAVNGKYPDEEVFFLQCILNFFEESLMGHPELDQEAFLEWLGKRCAQIERGELVYIAHQIDFLVNVSPSLRDFKKQSASQVGTRLPETRNNGKSD